MNKSQKKLTGIKCSINDTKKTCDFTKDVTIRVFGDDVKNRFITMDKANNEQNNVAILLKGREMLYNQFESEIFPIQNNPIVSADLENSSSSEHPISSQKTSLAEDSNYYYEYVLPEEKISGKGLKLLTPKQMLQILPIALGQVESSNTSENLPVEIPQIISSLYQSKQITKNVCNKIMNSVKV